MRIYTDSLGTAIGNFTDIKGSLQSGDFFEIVENGKEIFLYSKMRKFRYIASLSELKSNSKVI